MMFEHPDRCYDIIEVCKKCKKSKHLETVPSEHRIKPVYKMIERCIYCVETCDISRKHKNFS